MAAVSVKISIVFRLMFQMLKHTYIYLVQTVSGKRSLAGKILLCLHVREMPHNVHLSLNAEFSVETV